MAARAGLKFSWALFLLLGLLIGYSARGIGRSRSAGAEVRRLAPPKSAVTAPLHNSSRDLRRSARDGDGLSDSQWSEVLKQPDAFILKIVELRAGMDSDRNHVQIASRMWQLFDWDMERYNRVNQRLVEFRDAGWQLEGARARVE